MSFLLLLALLSPDEIRVGVASNFQPTAERIAVAFEEKTGHRVVLISGSTGKLYAQIRNGAPIDVFCAADARRPALLMEEGIGKEQMTYAAGRLVLVGSLDAKRISLANPNIAPYGDAARRHLRALGLWSELEDRFVFGENVAQAYQFIRSGGAEAGFVALSQVIGTGATYRILDEKVRQDAVLLTDAGAAFFAFLASDEARAIMEESGYGFTGGETSEAAAASFDASPIVLTLQLAATTTIVLLLLGTPLAWWLARGRSKWRVVVEAITALPLVLPPTVLGFYLLVLLGPKGPAGAMVEWLGGPRMVFSFPGLLIGSVIYSLPFVVQPLQNSFRAIDGRLLEAAATLRAGPMDRFFRIAVPLAKPGFLTAAVLGFAHTVGEFGVVLMIGGSIPGKTRVLSIAIYEHVETLEYAQAHILAGGMLLFSFAVLLAVYGFNRRFERVAV